MTKLHDKKPLAFALMWIGIYIVFSSLAEELSRQIGLESSIAAAFHLLCSLFLLFWLKKQGLFRQYGLCAAKYPAKKFLYYIPLLLAASCNLWLGLRLNLSPLESGFYVLSMLCVGFLEEIIFRGFLFKAMSRDSIKSAIIVSSVTFGIGHIINLINGSGMGLVANLCQVVYAIAFGFLFVIIFHRGGSLLPCIMTHSTVNALSVFSTAPETAVVEIVTALILTAIGIIYTLILLKTLPAPEAE